MCPHLPDADCRGVLVSTGQDPEERDRLGDRRPDAIVPDPLAAAHPIAAGRGSPAPRPPQGGRGRGSPVCRAYARGSPLPIWYVHGMKTTIDKAGRVVIPAAIRARARLRPGTPLEVVLDDVSVRLLRKVPRPKLVRVGKRLVARPSVAVKDLPKVDLGTLVDEERNRWPW